MVELLNKTQLAGRFSTTESKVEEYMRLGMPIVRLGKDSPRFDPVECLEWLKNHAEAKEKANE